MNQEILVSIIIPSYNYGHFLNETLSDLIYQTHQNWECIIVDNASTDNTKEVVLSFQNKDARFKYLFQSIKGPSASRNLGLEHAKGNYIQFLDSDDLLQHDKLKNGLLLFNQNNTTDIVYSGMRYFSNDNKKMLFYSMGLSTKNDFEWMPYCQGNKINVLPYLLKQNIMVISSPLIKKKSLSEIGYFDETLAYNEDWELWLRFVFANKNIVYDSSINTFSLIRVHKTSHSNNPIKMYIAGLTIEKRYIEKIDDVKLKLDFQKKINITLYNIEKILKLERNNYDILTNTIQSIYSIVPKNKYKIWFNLAHRKQFVILKNYLLLNYYANAIIIRIKNA